MKNIKWLFFDIGSTLVDESIAYRKRIERTIADTDISYDEFYRKMVGISKQKENAYNSAVAGYGLNRAAWNSDDEVVYPDAEECLKELSKRYKIGIIANQNPGSRERLEKMGLLEYLDLVIASAEEGVAKPELRIFKAALSRAACKPEEAVMIGDRIDNDIIPANKIGITTVWIRQKYVLSEFFEPSIEFSFSTIDDAKIRCIAEHKIPRMSTGIQVYDDKLLNEMHRLPQTLEHMERMTKVIHNAGIKKLNIDLMYGFPNQTDIMLSNSLYSIRVLEPEQVTLYEMRYNRNGLDPASIDRNVLFRQYEYLFNGLMASGYKGRFGQNTFSKFEDEGVSSYLYSRMFLGRPYKGFGVSAQSMSGKGIAYNMLKSDNSQYMPGFDEISEEYSYLLPKEELAAKYICISLYSGRFNLSVLERILSCDPLSYYHNEFRFLTEHQYVEISNGICTLTKEGFRLYGAVAALFWSAYHREQYIKMNKGE